MLREPPENHQRCTREPEPENQNQRQRTRTKAPENHTRTTETQNHSRTTTTTQPHKQTKEQGNKKHKTKVKPAAFCGTINAQRTTREPPKNHQPPENHQRTRTRDREPEPETKNQRQRTRDREPEEENKRTTEPQQNHRTAPQQNPQNAQRNRETKNTRQKSSLPAAFCGTITYPSPSPPQICKVAARTPSRRSSNFAKLGRGGGGGAKTQNRQVQNPHPPTPPTSPQSLNATKPPKLQLTNMHTRTHSQLNTAMCLCVCLCKKGGLWGGQVVSRFIRKIILREVAHSQSLRPQLMPSKAGPHPHSHSPHVLVYGAQVTRRIVGWASGFQVAPEWSDMSSRSSPCPKPPKTMYAYPRPALSTMAKTHGQV